MRKQNQLFRFFCLALCLGFASHAAGAATVSDFEDVVIPSGGFLDALNGAPEPGFTSQGVQYLWSTSFGLPVEFSASNIADTTDYAPARDTHPYNSITGGGAGGSSQYAVANTFAAVELELPGSPVSIDLTNTTYAYYSMLNGDSFAKKFGGVSGDDPDFFVLTITGMNGANPVGSLDIYLADFRNINAAPDFILDDWLTVDLTSLSGANRLVFSMDSSDHFIFNNIDFGMNTPAYFALDNVVYTPEPSTVAIMAIGAAGLLRLRRRRGIRSEG